LVVQFVDFSRSGFLRFTPLEEQYFSHVFLSFGF
jgi:hypothetical protein